MLAQAWEHIMQPCRGTTVAEVRKQLNALLPLYRSRNHSSMSAAARRGRVSPEDGGPRPT